MYFEKQIEEQGIRSEGVFFSQWKALNRMGDAAEDASDSVNRLNVDMSLTGASARGMQWASQLPDAVKSGMERTAEEIEKGKEETAQYWDDFYSAQEQAISNFQSTIQSALSPTAVTGADMAAAEAGTYIQKWDEAARRADAIAARGFAEIENLTILPESDVTKEYGPEALVILDRAFYLAELPRPEIGVSAQRIQQVEKIAGHSIPVEQLQAVLRSYKRGDIEADDLIDMLMSNIGVTDEQATEVIHRVFPELYKLKPVPTDKTLRSHMSATWFHTLAAMQDKATYPVALFAVGPRYRNEQREDAHHLRVHHSASMVIMDPEMSLEAGRDVAADVLRAYGFEDVRFETKAATSKYYTPHNEEEVFVKYHDEWVELADIGMYSPVALANFEIRYPVFNAGFGIERMAMILQQADDIRKLVVSGAQALDIKAACRKNKMLNLQEQAIRKVVAGVTSIKEVIRVTQPKQSKKR